MPEENEMQLLRKVAKEMFSVAMDALYEDNHYWSTRPCPTCRAITAMVGFDVGCSRMAKDETPRAPRR